MRTINIILEGSIWIPQTLVTSRLAPDLQQIQPQVWGLGKVRDEENLQELVRISSEVCVMKNKYFTSRRSWEKVVKDSVMWWGKETRGSKIQEVDIKSDSESMRNDP